jgi:glycopeptide antibiotics resistance protein
VIGAEWLLPLLGAYLVTILIRVVRGHPPIARGRLVTTTTTVLYALSVAAITVFPIHRRPPDYWAGEPWWTVIHWIPFVVDAPSFVLNIVMFVPFGVLVPLLWRRLDSWPRLTGCALAASATIELTQFVLGVTLGSRRTVDINDLIANTAGALLGLLMLRLAVPHAVHRGRIAAATAPRAAPTR